MRESSKSGRRGVGTTNHCMHGAHAIIEEVLDWRPFDYLTLTTLLPMPDAPKVLMTYAFSETRRGGRHAYRDPRGQAQAERQGVPRACRRGIPEDHHRAKSQPCGGMLEGQEDAPAVVEEPALPVSAERFLTQPVNAR